MLAIDTNVVVRVLANDDPIQSIRARDVVLGADVFVSLTVVLETAWVLRSIYGYSQAQVAGALMAFAGLPTVTLEDAPRLAQALAWASAGMDFADALHLAGAEGCDAFVSFDHQLARAAAAVDWPRVQSP